MDVSQYDEMSESEAMALFKDLHARALTLGLKQHQLCRLKFVTKARKARLVKLKNRLLNLSKITLSLVAIFGIILVLDWPMTKIQIAQTIRKIRGYSSEEIEAERCLFRASSAVQNLARPLMDCGFCRGVSEVMEVSNISRSEFLENFAYSGQPVVISDGCLNWSAVNVFSFDFFKDTYKPATHKSQANFQFFPYQTEFRELYEVFQMNSSRVRLQNGAKPWYIGWSNCDTTVSSLLRQHYGRPYFLPAESESSKTDWIFMGSPGYGAHMHVDNVGLPSWQAQIKGQKKWLLQPPPECYFKCVGRMEVTVKPGGIIVLNTNKWYHSTLVEGDDISITIGSEYD